MFGKKSSAVAEKKEHWVIVVVSHLGKKISYSVYADDNQYDAESYADRISKEDKQADLTDFYGSYSDADRRAKELVNE